MLDQVADDQASPLLDGVGAAHGWLLLVGNDVAAAHQLLTTTAPTALHAGSVRIAVWSYVWLAQAGFLLAAGTRRSPMPIGRSRSEESGHDGWRPLARYAAVAVPAARGEWAAAEEHSRRAWRALPTTSSWWSRAH
jgi:hypothetical protein